MLSNVPNAQITDGGGAGGGGATDDVYHPHSHQRLSEIINCF